MLGEGLRAVSIACDGDRAAVGAVGAGGAKGRIVLMTRGAGGWAAEGAIEARGEPSEILLSGGRIAAIVRRGRSRMLAMTDASTGVRPVLLPVGERASGLAVSPDGASFLLADGSTIRSYRIADGRTWMIFPFESPIEAIAARAGIPRILVALGHAIVAVDPSDRATRGVLPIRARVDLPGPVVAMTWTGDGRVAAALVREPPSLIFLNGDDLGEIDRRAVRAAALAPEGPERVVWIDAAPGAAVREASVSEAGPAASTAPPAIRGTKPEKGAASGYPPSSLLAPAPPAALPPPVVAPSESADTVETPAPAPSSGISRSVPSSPREPRPPTDQQAASSQPPASAPHATASPTQHAASAPPPASAPQATASSPQAAPPPAAPAADREELAGGSKRDASPAAESALPAGTIAGRLDGKAELVEQVVVLGPDSVITERARAHPETRNGATQFRIVGLQPGHYRIVPMGKGGTSLLARPRFASVQLSAEAGVRADFTIDGTL